MSLSNLSLTTDLITLQKAVTLVPYSRDYLARLAREGKIVSVQTDKQWMVSENSLLNFFEQAAIEDSVKKRILSVSRKNDLEVKEYYTQKITQIFGRQTNFRNSSLAAVVLILGTGLLSGLYLYTLAQMVAQNPEISPAQVLSAVTSTSHEAMVVRSNQNNHYKPAVFLEHEVEDVTETMNVESGIVLFPRDSKVSATTVEAVAEFFSDDVEVVSVGTSTGIVRSKHIQEELPFIRVPNRAP